MQPEIERVAKWLRRLTRKPKVRTAVGSNPALDSLFAVCNSSPGRPEPCEGNLVAVAGSCSGLMVKHPWPLLEISLSDFRRLTTLNVNTYLPTCLYLDRCLFSKSPLLLARHRMVVYIYFHQNRHAAEFWLCWDFQALPRVKDIFQNDA